MGIYGYMDIYWILQISSKIRRMCVQFSECSSKFSQHFVQMSGFRVSQQGASVWWLPAALRRPQKKHAPGILEHVSCVFCRCLLIFMILSVFAGFRVSQPCASVWWLPAALRRPQKKHALDFWSMYLVDFVIC